MFSDEDENFIGLRRTRRLQRCEAQQGWGVHRDLQERALNSALAQGGEGEGGIQHTPPEAISASL